MVQDAWHTQDYSAKFKIWLMSTGWRPDDVKAKYPVSVIDDPSNQVKYGNDCSTSLQFWSWFQLVLTHVFVIYLLVNFEEIGFPRLFSFSAFLFLHIYAFTTLMDLNRQAVWVELVKCAFGLYLIHTTGDWFGLNALWSFGSVAMYSYLLGSFTIVSLFTYVELKTK